MAAEDWLTLPQGDEWLGRGTATLRRPVAVKKAPGTCANVCTEKAAPARDLPTVFFVRPHCPHCGSYRIKQTGAAKPVYYYKCLEARCKKKFKAIEKKSF